MCGRGGRERIGKKRQCAVCASTGGRPARANRGGEILLDGVDLLKLSEREMRTIRGNRIAMVFQEPGTALNPVLTIGRQLTEGLELHKGLSHKEALKEAIDLLGLVGIPNPEQRIKDYPYQFSGGMQQRIMIAMAMSCSPDVLIADEPTTALDVTVQAQLLEVLNGLRRQYGTALVIITHNLGVVARYAEKVQGGLCRPSGGGWNCGGYLSADLPPLHKGIDSGRTAAGYAPGPGTGGNRGFSS